MTTKVSANSMGYEAAKEQIDASLSATGLDYLGLMLIHSPEPWTTYREDEHFFEEHIEVWRAMEEAYEAGKLRAIGVANFERKDLDNLFDNAGTRPCCRHHPRRSQLSPSNRSAMGVRRKGRQPEPWIPLSGSNDIDEVAVTPENSGSNAPIDVKTKAPNELGLYDMSGNAYEWVDDYAGSYSSEAQTDPQSTAKSNSYIKRGGSNYHSLSSEPYLFTTTGRYFYGSTDWTIGIRVCLY